MNDSIDPKDAAVIVDVIADDLPRPAAEVARRRVVVRLLKQVRRHRRELAPDVRVRSLSLLGEETQPLRARNFFDRRPLVREYVVYAATFLNYDARRIVPELQAKCDAAAVVRVSSIRALMHSVRIPEVRETIEFEEEIA